MTTYGTKAEREPILSQRTHPLPGEGGWGEREWAGGISTRMLGRPFIDPILHPIEFEGEGYDEPENKFRYLKETGVILRDFFAVKLVAFKPQMILLYSLLMIAVAVDGFRPIALVWAKGGLPKYPFMFSVWVVIVKFLTVLFSAFMLFLAYKRGEESSADLSLWKKAALSVYFLVPVLCYVFSDILNFVLFEHHISPTLFVGVKQSRIVITAIMFRYFLSNHISPIQWIAVFQLCLASVLLVAEDTSKSDTAVDSYADQLTGIFWLIFKCFLDSVAIIWMDKYFKKLDNAGFPYAEQQLIFSLQSLFAGIVFVLVYNKDELFSGRPLLDGFNEGAWVSAFITAFYGILVSLVLRYLDSMVKQFQALASVVITTVLDQLVFGKVVSLTSWIAICIILISVFLYKLGAAGKKKHS